MMTMPVVVAVAAAEATRVGTMMARERRLPSLQLSSSQARA